MKKLLSMAMAIAMSLSLVVTAHAAGSSDDLLVETLRADGTPMADSESTTISKPFVELDQWTGSLRFYQDMPINVVPYDTQLRLKNVSTDPGCYFIVTRDEGRYMDRAGMLKELQTTEDALQKYLAGDFEACDSSGVMDSDPAELAALNTFLTGDNKAYFYATDPGSDGDAMRNAVYNGKLLAILGPGDETTIPLPMYDLSNGAHGRLMIYGRAVNMDMLSDEHMTPDFLAYEFLPATDYFDRWYIFQSNSDVPRLRFKDVKSSDWYFDSIRWAASNNVVSGTSAYTFSPKDTCSKAQILQMLYSASGQREFYGESYPGLKGTEWYHDAVSFAYAQGILEAGVDVTSPCTRADAMYYQYMLEHTLVAAPDTSNISFNDVAEGSKYAEAIKWASAQGITSGVGNGKFAPDSICTRAQIVTFLYNSRDILAQLQASYS